MSWRMMSQSRHSEEVSLMYLWQEDYDRASYYADNAIQIFLQVVPKLLLSHIFLHIKEA